MRKNIIFYITFCFSLAALARENSTEIRDYLKIVETNNRPHMIGDGGDSYGILQIQLNTIKDVNKKYGTFYTHEDAFDERCAEEIFDLYIRMWTEHLEKKTGSSATEYDIVRIWNGGPNGYKRKATLPYLERYKKIKNKMSKNKRKCTIDGKLGIVMSTYTHTMDVFMFKTRTTKWGVNRRYVKLLPREAPKVDTGQLTLSLCDE